MEEEGRWVHSEEDFRHTGEIQGGRQKTRREDHAKIHALLGPAGLELCGILVANATCFLICYQDSHVVANICYCHQFMVLLI